MTDALVERISDWSAIAGIAIGLVAWWFAREDASRKADELDRYKTDSKTEVARLNGETEKTRSENVALALRVEELRAKNNELDKHLSPRELGEQSLGGKMTPFAGINARIIASPEHNCTLLAEHLKLALMLAGLKIEQGVETSFVLDNGVRVDVSPLLPKRDDDAKVVEERKYFDKCAWALLGVLNERKIESCLGGRAIRSWDTFRGIVITVGPRPRPEEAEEMHDHTTSLDPNLSSEEKEEARTRDQVRMWKARGLIPKDEPLPRKE